MYSYNQFQRPPDDFQMSTQFPNEFTKKFSAFVRSHQDEVELLLSPKFPSHFSLNKGREIVGIGDQIVKFPIREIHNQEQAASLYEAYSSGLLVNLFYITYPSYLKAEFIALLDSVDCTDHNLHIPKHLTVLDLSPTVKGSEVWEMFPDPNEQQAMKDLPPEDLGPALWQSGAFVFGTAIPEIARNISVEKAVAVFTQAFTQHPDDQAAIIAQLKQTRESIQPWTAAGEGEPTSDLYTTEHIKRHTQIFEELDKFITANETI